MTEDSDSFSNTDPRVDKAIGSVIALIFIAGILGNSSAFCYFLQKRKSWVPNMNKLYIVITSFDILTTLLTIPVMTSLFNHRKPMLFESSAFCGAWTTTHVFLIRMSIFLVAVLSITRTIEIWPFIKLPFEQVKLSSIFVMITGYGTLVLTLDGAFFASGWIKGSYYPTLWSHCAFATTEHVQSLRAKTFLFVLFQVEVILPSILIFISLVMSSVSLIVGRRNITTENEREARHASITITLVIVVFLLCNMPTFVYQLLLNFQPSLLEAKKHNEMFKKYGNLILLYVPYILNAALNPLVYWLRMSPFREQCRKFARYFGSILKCSRVKRKDHEERSEKEEIKPRKKVKFNL